MKFKKTIWTAALLGLSGQLWAAQGFIRLASNTLGTGMSANGRYVVGVNQDYSAYGINTVSFLFDREDGETKWLTSWSNGAPDDFSKSGQFRGVADNGVVVGMTKSDLISLESWDGTIAPINVAAVWTPDGECTRLPYGSFDTTTFTQLEDGTFGLCISADGRVVGGDAMTDWYYQTPLMWSKDDDGQWSMQQLPLPEGYTMGHVIDISSDGTIIVGQVMLGSQLTQMAYWSGGACHILEQDLTSDYTVVRPHDISANGRFIAYDVNQNDIRVYDIETDEVRIIPGNTFDDYVNDLAVDDQGNVYGTILNGSPYFGVVTYDMFWYNYASNERFAYDYYLKLFAPDASTSFRSPAPFAVSADGTVLAGNNNTNGALREVPYTWLVESEPTDRELPATPSGVKGSSHNLNEVVLTWNTNDKTYETLTLKAYNIYRDNTLVATVDAGQPTTLTEQGVPSGYPAYSVEAVYLQADGTTLNSQLSRPVSVAVAKNYDLPLFDTFESNSFNTNFWTIERSYGNPADLEWYVNDWTGLDYSRGVYTSTGSHQPYSSSLVSRPIDASGVDYVTLSFALQYAYYGMEEGDVPHDSLSVDVTTDKGATWTTVKDWTAEQFSQSWSIMTADLSEAVAGQQFSLRLRRHGQGALEFSLMLDNIKIGSVSEHDAPYDLVGTQTDGGSVNLAWKNDIDAYQLNYIVDKGTQNLTLGNEGAELIAANKFEADDLKLYDGKYLTAVSTIINYYDWVPTEKGIHAKAVIFEDGVIVREQEITDIIWNDYSTVVLDEPLRIDASKVLHVGIKVYDYDAEQIPLVYVNSDAYTPGKSDLYSEDGGLTWHTVGEYYSELGWIEGGYCNWEITALITETPDFAPATSASEVLGYNIYRNGEQLNRGLIPSNSSHFTDVAPLAESCYDVIAFYKDGSESERSAQWCLEDMSTGLRLLTDVQLRIVGETLFIEGRYDRASLYTSDGRRMADASHGSLSLNRLTKGVYIIEVVRDGKFMVKKISR